MLRAIAAVGDHEVDTVGDGGPGLLAGIAIAVRHAGVPRHAMLAEHVVEDVEDGLILAGGRVDDHMHTPIRGIRHLRLLPPALPFPETRVPD